MPRIRMDRLDWRWAFLATGVLFAAVVMGGCSAGIRGHGEIGQAGGALEVGTIGADDSERAVHVDLTVETGVVRVEFVDAVSAVVWAGTATPSDPLRDDIVMPAGAGPWTATLVAVEAPMVADYRIEPAR